MNKKLHSIELTCSLFNFNNEGVDVSILYPVFEDRVLIDCVLNLFLKSVLRKSFQILRYTVPKFYPDASERIFAMIQSRVFPIKITS